MKKIGQGQLIENTQTFRQAILQSLSKLNDPATQGNAEEEFKEICDVYGQDLDRINVVIQLLCENYQDFNSRLSTKKEYIKLFGVTAEVYGFKILEYLPKILQTLNKKLKENDNSLHVIIGDTFGQITEHTLKQLTTEEALPYISQILRLLFQNLGQNSKFIQAGSSIALSRVIQSCPLEILYILSDDVMQKIMECLQNSSTFKAQNNILEALLSMLVGVEERFKTYCGIVLPAIILHMTDQQWSVRKIAVDIIYTLAILMPEQLIPYKKKCMDILNQSRFDKIKHVRDASIVALNVIKDLQQPNDMSQNDSEYHMNDPQEEMIELNEQLIKEPNYQLAGQHQPNYSNDYNNQHQQHQPYQQQQQQQQNKQQKQNQTPKLPKNAKKSKSYQYKSPAGRQKSVSPIRDNGKIKYAQTQEHNNHNLSNVQKESIFKGPKNPNFFKNAQSNKDDIQILVNENQKNNINNNQNNSPQRQNNEQSSQNQEDQNLFYQQSKNSSGKKQKYVNQVPIQTVTSVQQQQDTFQDNFNTFNNNNNVEYQNNNQGDETTSSYQKLNDIKHINLQQQSQQKIVNNNVIVDNNFQNSNQKEQQDYIKQNQNEISMSQQQYESLFNRIQQMQTSQQQMQLQVNNIEQDHQQEVQGLNKRIDFLEEIIEKIYTMLSSDQKSKIGNFQGINLDKRIGEQQSEQNLLQQHLKLQQQSLQNQNQNNNNNNNNQIQQTANFNNLQNLLTLGIPNNQQQQNQNQQPGNFGISFGEKAQKQMQELIQYNQQNQYQQQLNNNSINNNNIFNQNQQFQQQPQLENQQLNGSIIKPSQLIEKNMQKQQQLWQEIKNQEDQNNNNYNNINNYQQNRQNNHQETKFNNYLQSPKRFSPHKDLMPSQQNSNSKRQNQNQSPKRNNQYQEHNIVEKIKNGIYESKYNEVYGLVLTQNDDKLLVKTLNDTGICIKELDNIHLEFLLTKLKSFLFRNEYIEQSLPWVYETIVVQQIKISPLLMRSMRETLKRLLDNNSSNHVLQQKDIISCQKILQQINTLKID